MATRTRKTNTTSKKTPVDPNVTIDELIQQHKLPRDTELLLVGDGSGSMADRSAGSAVILVDRLDGGRHLLVDAFSCLSIGFAELWPYLHALLYHYDRVGRERLARSGRTIQVSILTDSELVARQGGRVYKRTTLSPLWASMDELQRKGYCFHWQWIDRATVALNELADYYSVRGRLAIDPIHTEANTEVIYQTNPSSRGANRE